MSDDDVTKPLKKHGQDLLPKLQKSFDTRKRPTVDTSEDFLVRHPIYHEQDAQPDLAVSLEHIPPADLPVEGKSLFSTKRDEISVQLEDNKSPLTKGNITSSQDLYDSFVIVDSTEDRDMQEIKSYDPRSEAGSLVDRLQKHANDSRILPEYIGASEITPLDKFIGHEAVELFTDTREEEEIKEDGTRVKRIITTIKHFTKVNEVEDNGEDGARLEQKLLGTEVNESILELAPGISEDSKNLSTKNFEHKSEVVLPNGTWLRKRILLCTVQRIYSPGKKTDRAVLSIEGDLSKISESFSKGQFDSNLSVPQKSIKEENFVKPDGTRVRKIITETRHMRIKDVSDAKHLGATPGSKIESKSNSEVLIGLEIDEDVLEIAPGITDSELNLYPIEISEKMEDGPVQPDGSWRKRRIQLKIIQPLESTTDLDNREALYDSSIKKIEELKKNITTQNIGAEKDQHMFQPSLQEEVREENYVKPNGTRVKKIISVTRHVRTKESSEFIKSGALSAPKKSTTEILIGTEIKEDILEIAPGIGDDEINFVPAKISEKTEDLVETDGSWTKRTIRLKVIQGLESVDHLHQQKIRLESDFHVEKELEKSSTTQAISAGKILEPIAKGEDDSDLIQRRNSVKEENYVKPDGTRVRKIITETRHMKPKNLTNETMLASVPGSKLEVVSDSEVLICTEIDEDVLEIAPGTDDSDLDRCSVKITEKVEEEPVLSDGSWKKRKIRLKVIKPLAFAEDLHEQEIGSEPISSESDELKKNIKSPSTDTLNTSSEQSMKEKIDSNLVSLKTDIKEESYLKLDGTRVKKIITERRYTRNKEPRKTGNSNGLSDANLKTGNDSDILIGIEIEEDIVEISPGICDADVNLYQAITTENVEEDPIESDGIWRKRNIHLKVIAPLATSGDLHKQKIESESTSDVAGKQETYQLSPEILFTKEVKEVNYIKPDGTKVKKIITETRHVRSKKLIESSKSSKQHESESTFDSEILLGTEIDEEIIEIAPEISDACINLYPAKTTEKTEDQVQPDSSWIKRRVRLSVIARPVSAEDLADRDGLYDSVGKEVDKLKTDSLTPLSNESGVSERHQAVMEPLNKEILDSHLIELRKNIIDKSYVKPDGTRVQKIVTEIRHIKSQEQPDVEKRQLHTESKIDSEKLIGLEIYEDVLEVAPGISDAEIHLHPAKTLEKSDNKVESDGNWCKQTIRLRVIHPFLCEEKPDFEEVGVEKITQQRVENPVRDNGTHIHRTITTTTHIRPLELLLTLDNEDTTVQGNVSKIIGVEIEEDIFETAPGVQDTIVGKDDISISTVSNEEDILPSGVWRKVQIRRTRVKPTEVTRDEALSVIEFEDKVLNSIDESLTIEEGSQEPAFLLQKQLDDEMINELTEVIDKVQRPTKVPLESIDRGTVLQLNVECQNDDVTPFKSTIESVPKEEDGKTNQSTVDDRYKEVIVSESKETAQQPDIRSQFQTEDMKATCEEVSQIPEDEKLLFVCPDRRSKSPSVPYDRAERDEFKNSSSQENEFIFLDHPSEKEEIKEKSRPVQQGKDKGIKLSSDSESIELPTTEDDNEFSADRYSESSVLSEAIDKSNSEAGPKKSLQTINENVSRNSSDEKLLFVAPDRRSRSPLSPYDNVQQVEYEESSSPESEFIFLDLLEESDEDGRQGSKEEDTREGVTSSRKIQSDEKTESSAYILTKKKGDIDTFITPNEQIKSAIVQTKNEVLADLPQGAVPMKTDRFIHQIKPLSQPENDCAPELEAGDKVMEVAVFETIFPQDTTVNRFSIESQDLFSIESEDVKLSRKDKIIITDQAKTTVLENLPEGADSSVHPMKTDQILHLTELLSQPEHDRIPKMEASDNEIEVAVPDTEFLKDVTISKISIEYQDLYSTEAEDVKMSLEEKITSIPEYDSSALKHVDKKFSKNDDKALVLELTTSDEELAKLPGVSLRETLSDKTDERLKEKELVDKKDSLSLGLKSTEDKAFMAHTTSTPVGPLKDSPLSSGENLQDETLLSDRAKSPNEDLRSKLTVTGFSTEQLTLQSRVVTQAGVCDDDASVSSTLSLKRSPSFEKSVASEETSTQETPANLLTPPIVTVANRMENNENWNQLATELAKSVIDDSRRTFGDPDTTTESYLQGSAKVRLVFSYCKKLNYYFFILFEYLEIFSN